MSLPPVPPTYDSWNAYIEEQGAIVATAIKITSTEWIISGTGLT